MTRWLTFPERQATKRQAEIRLARLKEVWGDDYDGQKTWPDLVTNEAVGITTLKDGSRGLHFDDRHEKHLKASERSQAKTHRQMRDEKRFRDEDVDTVRER